MTKRINQFKYLTIALMLCFLISQGCSNQKECPKCQGTGRMVHEACQGTGLAGGGTMQDFECSGTGKRKCSQCDGTGKIEK